MLSAAHPSISVIIPHLNQADSLRRCLRSLAEQTNLLKSVEVIVVDNGSRELPSWVSSEFEGVTLEQENVAGPGPARNFGVARSHGEVLAFIDADCIADPNWLPTIAKYFSGKVACSIIGGDVRIAVSKPSRLTMLEAYESIFAYRQEEYITQHGFSGTGNLAATRAAFEAIGPFAGLQFAEDRDWGRRAKSLGYKVEFMPDMIVYHPARESLSELFQKWDRHIDHHYLEWSKKRFGGLRWLLRSFLVAVSPAAEIVRIALSTRVSGFRSRLLAATGMTITRIYRARQMISRLFAGSAASKVTWNR